MSYELVPPPCKNIKCISYPVCRHKQIIECETLVIYYGLWFKMEYPWTASHIWSQINRVLPQAIQAEWDGELIRHPALI